jgi:hypothetical protein
MIAMRHDPFGTRLRHGLIASVCGALLALGSVGAAKAQQAESDDDSFEQRIIKGILGGLGVDVGNKRGIEYRERSPLVIPPSLDLPPPDQANVSAQNPAWPREQTRKKTAVQAKPQMYSTPEDPGTSSRMSPDELRRGTSRNAGRVTDPSKSGSQEDIDIGRPLRPNELGSSSIFNWRALTGNYGDETAKFDGEPSRGQLTQPPPGYQTPSPSQPYGTASDKGPGWKIPTILSRPEGTPDN